MTKIFLREVCVLLREDWCDVGSKTPAVVECGHWKKNMTLNEDRRMKTEGEAVAQRLWPRFWTLGTVDCCGVSPVIAMFPAGLMLRHCITTRMAKLLDVRAVYRWLVTCIAMSLLDSCCALYLFCH